MALRERLYLRRCVEELVTVLGQVPLRASARAPMVLDETTVRWVALWTLLRWERNFLLLALERRGVDVWALTCAVDELIKRRRDSDAASAGDRWAQSAWPRWDHLILRLADEAAAESAAMGHWFVGVEHLLLAAASRADDALAEVLRQHGVGHEALRETVAGLVPPQAAAAAGGRPAPGPRGPAGAAWDAEAVGVPRQFGMAVVMLITAMYAVLFAAMKLLDFHPAVFIVIAVLFTGIGLGQMLLFGGRYPRAASVWVGACLLPVETLGVWIYVALSEGGIRWTEAIAPAFCSLLFAVPAGAAAGYVAGVLTAGVFLLIERFGNRETPPES